MKTLVSNCRLRAMTQKLNQVNPVMCVSYEKARHTCDINRV